MYLPNLCKIQYFFIHYTGMIGIGRLLNAYYKMLAKFSQFLKLTILTTDQMVRDASAPLVEDIVYSKYPIFRG